MSTDPLKDVLSVTRLEVIDETGRVLTCRPCEVDLSFQDDNRTLKVFVKGGRSQAREALVLHEAPPARWMVVRKRETDAPEVWTFNDYDDAARHWDKAQTQWTDVYFCRITYGPKGAGMAGERPTVPPSARGEAPLPAPCPTCAIALKQRESDITYIRKLEAELATFRKVQGYEAPLPAAPSVVVLLQQLHRDIGTVRSVLDRKQIKTDDDTAQDQMLGRWQEQLFKVLDVLTLPTTPSTGETS